jgi:ABC-type spermidine/putrescine transport system permease subunit I
MIHNNISLVDWGMGTAIIGVFVVVCIVLVLIVVNMMNSDKKKED